MCPPRHYDVRYVINPWMEGNVRRSSRELAAEQWERLYEAVQGVAQVALAEPDPGSPDMVFAANAGLVHQKAVVLSRFLHPERQGEEEHFRAWFQAAGFRLHDLPENAPFEGEGDALFTPDGSRLWAGWGWRTSLASHGALQQIFHTEVASLKLVDPRFYHLDTCFCPLSGGDAMYYPGAFDRASLDRIESWYAPEQLLRVSEGDAVRFACNAVNIRRTILLNQVTPALRQELERRGYTVVEVPLSEFMRAGGAAKCLTLRLSELDVSYGQPSSRP